MKRGGPQYMKPRNKKIIAVALAVTMTASLFGSQVSAMQYTGTGSYMSGKYYRNLQQVKLTGDARTDIVAIAAGGIHCRAFRICILQAHGQSQCSCIFQYIHNLFLHFSHLLLFYHGPAAFAKLYCHAVPVCMAAGAADSHGTAQVGRIGPYYQILLLFRKSAAEKVRIIWADEKKYHLSFFCGSLHAPAKLILHVCVSQAYPFIRHSLQIILKKQLRQSFIV